VLIGVYLVGSSTSMGLKTVAAYLLLALGGNASPSADQIASVITAGGGEADTEAIETLLKELEGKVGVFGVDICIR